MTTRWLKNSTALAAALLGLATLASPALGQGTLVAACKPVGDGARVYLSSVTPDEAAVLAGIDLPITSDPVLFVGVGARPIWYERGSLASINALCGGEDEEPFIELFADTGIQPRDGTWQTRVAPARMEGCPAMMAGALERTMPSADDTTRRVTFPRPFDPNQLPRDFNPGHQWAADGENRWRTNLFSQETAIGGPAGMQTQVDLEMVVASPTEMRTIGSVLLQLPQIAREAMGMTGDCRIITRSLSQWIAD